MHCDSIIDSSLIGGGFAGIATANSLISAFKAHPDQVCLALNENRKGRCVLFGGIAFCEECKCNATFEPILMMILGSVMSVEEAL